MDSYTLGMGIDSQHGKGLQRMIVFGTALSFAFLAAIALSMKDFIGGNASFEFSYKTLLGFAVGFGVGLLFWTVVNRWMRKADKNKQSGST